MRMNDGVIVGMEPADIFLEMERGRIEETQLFLGQLILKAFDNFDKSYQVYSPGEERLGFHMNCGPQAIRFSHPYAIRPAALVEEAINEVFPKHQHLMTNVSVDHGGYVVVRGMHANNILKHPYTAAALGLTERKLETRILPRLAALNRAGIPGFSEETNMAIQRTMEHNGRAILHRLEDFMKHANHFLPKNMKDELTYLDNLAQGAACLFTSEDDDLSDEELRFMAGRRSQFLMRYPEATDIFRPFHARDETMNAIRIIAQTHGNLRERDFVIRKKIGETLWHEFREDPGAFCARRTKYEREALDEDEAHPSP